MMRIKKISFIDEVENEYSNSIDVRVEFEDGYSYTIVVRTPDDLVQEMLQEKTNFIEPASSTIIVKRLTKEIITEAIKTYAKDEGYWLKLCQFGDELDISVFNKLEAQHIVKTFNYLNLRD